MKEIKIVIERLYDVGVTKEKTLEIMHELLDNSIIYAGNQDSIDAMLHEKLTIDQIISLKSNFDL